jgi:hypothetical protein
VSFEGFPLAKLEALALDLFDEAISFHVDAHFVNFAGPISGMVVFFVSYLVFEGQVWVLGRPREHGGGPLHSMNVSMVIVGTGVPPKLLLLAHCIWLAWLITTMGDGDSKINLYTKVIISLFLNDNGESNSPSFLSVSNIRFSNNFGME